MSTLLHQNMRNFGGNTQLRVQGYRTAFTTIANGQGNPPLTPIIAAGFTEITNNGTAAGALGTLCNDLNIVFRGLIACGQMTNQPEYIGLGSSANNVPLAYRRVLIQATGGNSGIRLINDRAPATQGVFPVAWAQTLPPAATPFYRGFVYMIIPVNNTLIAVAYIHNIFGILGNALSIGPGSRL